MIILLHRKASIEHYRQYRSGNDSKEAIMAVIGINELILLFRPEESPRLPEEQDPMVTAFLMLNAKSSISLKALVWTVIAILIGLVVGQL